MAPNRFEERAEFMGISRILRSSAEKVNPEKSSGSDRKAVAAIFSRNEGKPANAVIGTK